MAWRLAACRGPAQVCFDRQAQADRNLNIDFCSLDSIALSIRRENVVTI